MTEIEIKSIDDLIAEIRKLKSIYGKQPIWFSEPENSEWNVNRLGERYVLCRIQ